jgi:enoyl-CoA hydratase/carnithine racemase
MRTGTGLFHGEGNTLADTYRTGIQQIPRLLERMGTPLIAAVNGPAVGAGCDLALMCDLRIGSPRASFAESFVRLGIISGDGGAWILPRAVGFSVACDMALTGRTLTSQEALQAGLISRLTGEDNLMDEAQEMAARIAANPPSAVRIMRQQLRHQHHQTLDEALEFSAVAQAERHACQDHLAILNSLNISRA